MQSEFTTKICSHCKIDKPLNEFYNERKNSDGKANYCKVCMKAIRKIHHEKNKEHDNKRALQYYRNNKDKVYEQQQIYNKSENGKIANRKSRKKHYQKVKDEYPELFETNTIRSIISSRFSNKRGYRYNFGLKIKGLNYTYNELRKWLESQFTDEMNWDNYGNVWEIDHINPICSFDLRDRKQFKECWKIENIRPMLKNDHLNKIKNDLEKRIK